MAVSRLNGKNGEAKLRSALNMFRVEHLNGKMMTIAWVDFYFVGTKKTRPQKPLLYYNLVSAFLYSNNVFRHKK